MTVDIVLFTFDKLFFYSLIIKYIILIVSNILTT